MRDEREQTIVSFFHTCKVETIAAVSNGFIVAITSDDSTTSVCFVGGCSGSSDSEDDSSDSDSFDSFVPLESFEAERGGRGEKDRFTSGFTDGAADDGLATDLGATDFLEGGGGGAGTEALGAGGAAFRTGGCRSTRRNWKDTSEFQCCKNSPILQIVEFTVGN
jgi:hypothetical protein